MKMKLALFMFAIGLGSSCAYAASGPRPGCIAQCTAEYKRCILSQSVEECRVERLDCNQQCYGIPL
jgi:hypothetical protein